MQTDDGKTEYVRRNIWHLEARTPWDPITVAYAEAIKVLQARPLEDPTSWKYLSAVHGRCGFLLPGAEWNQCQHGSWYFLPWHRMYLHYFERIVRAEVIRQGGPEDWALPFWDYSNPVHAALPPAFRRPSMPDGSANPLFVVDRSAAHFLEPAVNDGGEILPQSATAEAALDLTSFTAQPPVPSFGGGATTPSQFFNARGLLERTPHGDVHVLVGGDDGLMTDPDRAPLDPIFWLHHSNIDRLWEVWLARGGGRANPVAPEWLEQTFTFHDESGNPQSPPVSAFLDTTALGYTYEGVVPLPMAPAAEEAPASAGTARSAAMPDPEMVGASEQPLELTGAPIAVEVVIDRRAVQDRARDLPEAAGPEHVYLSLEDIEATRNPGVVYGVYISAGPDSPQEPRHIGNVSFFGIEHLSRTDLDQDGPHGFRESFDITGHVEEMRAGNAWDEERVTVSFRPLGLRPGADAAPRNAPPEERRVVRTQPVRIGRVSMFHG